VITKRTSVWLLAAAVLGFSILACNFPLTPSPTELPPTQPPSTIAPSPEPTVPPPTTPAADWLPEGTVALYIAGPWENPQLYALSADGTPAGLDRVVHQGAVTTPSGRWLAYPDGSSATSATIVNLEEGTEQVVSATADFTFYSMAFDRAETRVALLELGPPEPDNTPWAIVVVHLADGSIERFATTVGPGQTQLPGNPLGWTASGEELLLDTFQPYTEGAHLGIWAVHLPPGTVSAPLDTFSRREVLGAWWGFAPVHLSPDQSKLVYLDRDPDYTPDDYDPVAYDLAVNRLWRLALADGSRTLLLEVSDGDALGQDAAWSPDGQEILFARGHYSGDTFATLGLRVYTADNMVREIGPLDLPAQGYLDRLSWCRPELALATMTTSEGTAELHWTDLEGGAEGTVASASLISVLGCIH